MTVTVGIVGGGIGGLTAAIALRAVGFDVTIFERSAEREKQGVALLVWANAVRVLTALGMDILGISAPMERTEIRTSSGELLCSLPIAEWSANAGAASVAIRRPVLIDMLAAKLPGHVVETGRSVSRFEARGDRVRLHFERGAARDFDIVVGADGLSSIIRRQLHGPHTIRMLQQRAWVGLAHPAPGVLKSGVTTATIGHGPRFWVAPLPNGAAFWFATLNQMQSPDVGPCDFLRAGFADWPPTIGQLLEATLDEDVIEVRIRDAPPSERWGEGRVTLLGDAAHPSTPDLGQGACQAIESAACLAECLADSSDVSSSLRDYERRRMARTATISRMSRITSLNTTIESPILCALRDRGIRATLPTIARRHFAWIMGEVA